MFNSAYLSSCDQQNKFLQHCFQQIWFREFASFVLPTHNGQELMDVLMLDSIKEQEKQTSIPMYTELRDFGDVSF